MPDLIKIKIISKHQEYQKDQIYDLEEKIANALLTSGKALKIHRPTNEIKKSKKNDV